MTKSSRKRQQFAMIRPPIQPSHHQKVFICTTWQNESSSPGRADSHKTKPKFSTPSAKNRDGWHQSSRFWNDQHSCTCLRADGLHFAGPADQVPLWRVESIPRISKGSALGRKPLHLAIPMRASKGTLKGECRSAPDRSTVLCITDLAVGQRLYGSAHY